MKELQKKLLIPLFELYNKKMKYFLPLIIAFSILINPLNTLAEELILAGGCFWCLEHDLESLMGLILCKVAIQEEIYKILLTKIMKDIKKLFWLIMIPKIGKFI